MDKYNIEYKDHNSPENIDYESTEESEMEIISTTGRIEFIQMYTINRVLNDELKANLWWKIEEDVKGVSSAYARDCPEGTEVEVEMATIEGIQDIPILAKEVEDVIKAYLETI